MSNVSFQDFMSYLTKHSIARSNRFQVVIPLPEALVEETNTSNQRRVSNAFFDSSIVKLVKSYYGSGDAKISRGLEMMVEQTELPGKNITTVDVKYNSDAIKHPYNIIYAAQQFTFHVSRDMYEKNIMDEWMNLIIDPVTHVIGYYDEYTMDITVNQLDENDNIVQSVVLVDAFPINTNPLVLSNSETNMGHRLMCMFAYKRWKRVGENEDKETSAITQLSQTPLGPYITPILANPVVSKALEVLKENTGVDLEGEAVAIYNQIDGIVTGTTGTSINKATTLLEGVRASTAISGKVTPQQKARLIGIIDDALNALRS